jgi:hypothetical protein
MGEDCMVIFFKVEAGCESNLIPLCNSVCLFFFGLNIAKKLPRIQHCNL